MFINLLVSKNKCVPDSYHLEHELNHLMLPLAFQRKGRLGSAHINDGKSIYIFIVYPNPPPDSI